MLSRRLFVRVERDIGHVPFVESGRLPNREVDIRWSLLPPIHPSLPLTSSLYHRLTQTPIIDVWSLVSGAEMTRIDPEPPPQITRWLACCR